jgi:hypothetical protein
MVSIISVTHLPVEFGNVLNDCDGWNYVNLYKAGAGFKVVDFHCLGIPVQSPFNVIANLGFGFLFCSKSARAFRNLRNSQSLFVQFSPESKNAFPGQSSSGSGSTWIPIFNVCVYIRWSEAGLQPEELEATIGQTPAVVSLPLLRLPGKAGRLRQGSEAPILPADVGDTHGRSISTQCSHLLLGSS